MKNMHLYVIMALLVSSLMLMGSMPVKALTAENFTELSGSDPTGDVVDILDTSSKGDYPAIDIVHAEVKLNNGNVIADIQVAADVDVSDNTSLYLINIKDSNGNVVSLDFEGSDGAHINALNDLPSSEYWVDGNKVGFTIPLDDFSSLSDISEAQFATYHDVGDITYTDTLFLYPSSAGDSTNEGCSKDLSSVFVKGNDPQTESPTDSSVSVSITSVSYSRVVKGDMVESEIVIEGTSSGAKEIWISSALYYPDGGWNFGGYWAKGPFEICPETTVGSSTYHQLYLKGQGTDGGLEKWEFRFHETYPAQQNVDTSMTMYRAYVRAYSDNGWNQAYMDIDLQKSSDGNMISGSSDTSGNNGGSDTPGFEAVFAFIGIFTAAVIYSKRRKE
jgi:hypothetical protein